VKYSTATHIIQILNIDEKIPKLLEDISIQLDDYQALQQTKTALDMEILATILRYIISRVRVHCPG
jgi:hypothetical protein